MICGDIIHIIEESFPRNYALEWDNVGLLVGDRDQEIKKIYIALDATDEVIEEAITKGADLLLTHHPLIFRGLKRVTADDFIGRRIRRLIQNDLSYYAMHTNYDVLGMADLAGEMLSMEHAKVLELTTEDGAEGIGRIADRREAISLKECCEWVKERFQLPSVKVFGDPNRMVKRIAISPGSGKSVIGTAIEKGADVLITGDIDHHEGIDAVAQRMAVIDAGHYGIEHIYIADMKTFCETHFPELAVDTAGICQPFWII